MKSERFSFGENWSRFLSDINDKRIAEAERSLKLMLDVQDLIGKTFLDVGSGSGLFSLAACRLGAKVHSFDYDPKSVACTLELKRRYFIQDEYWKVEQGSVLDDAYLKRLGHFDIVYSWGVLHHTDDMWKALENLIPLVSKKGKLLISIYNDQGRPSQYWKLIKRTYNRLPYVFRQLLLILIFIRLWGPTMLRDLFRGRPFISWRSYEKDRGMSPWIDVVDWVGGYPFDVAKPEEIFHFYHDRGFILHRLKTCAGGRGCNEFVFIRNTEFQ